ncbi:flagellar basal body-associated FliL family protein [Planktotalea arctica]|uniref:flagellar basal body-associated FliL family protein n=1 Tax=Planktotalea arctica TaxID=1481893 RepID=UPI000A177FFA|nr:flagellar basal body-associated FliL family protein [Planktotalea arctica]
MANSELAESGTPEKSGKIGPILVLSVALFAGAGGFYATFSGLLPISGVAKAEGGGDDSAPLKVLGTNTYVSLDPLIVNIRSSSKYQLLRFVGQLEVKPEHAADIEALKPRLMDVMNTYLNALEAARFEDPIALIKLRAQLLRRMQIITGRDRIEDLLIMEFILQ